MCYWFVPVFIMQRDLGVTWDVDLYGELLKIGGGKERFASCLETF